MGELINSISFQDNQLIWLKADVGNNQTIHIQRVAESPLPFIINYENLNKPSASIQISNTLKSLQQQAGMGKAQVRVLLPARFGLIKKMLLDQYVPSDIHSSVIHKELSHIITGSIDDFYVYEPEYSRESNFMEERLVVAIRKEVLKTIERALNEAGMPLTEVNLNCFSLDNMYRQLLPNLLGETLLVNFTERGFELTISDSRNFLNYFFKPYSKSLQSIDELDISDITSRFVALVEDIQRPGAVDLPLYSISQIYLFGQKLTKNHLALIEQHHLPKTRIWDPLDALDWQIVLDENQSSGGETFRLVEPLSNLF